MKLDLNCDLGEGEPLSRTRSLMRWVTSANVACGGHAGDLPTMEACVRFAKQHGVRLGAHPGLWNRNDFGRDRAPLTPDGFELLFLQQVGALERVAHANGVRIHHIKLHGALYHASEEDEALAPCYAAVVKRFWPRARIYARAGGHVASVARRAGLVVWEEAFADRGYRGDGTLVPRTEPNALLAGTPCCLSDLRSSCRVKRSRCMRRRSAYIPIHRARPGSPEPWRGSCGQLPGPRRRSNPPVSPSSWRDTVASKSP